MHVSVWRVTLHFLLLNGVYFGSRPVVVAHHWLSVLRGEMSETLDGIHSSSCLPPRHMLPVREEVCQLAPH